MDIEAQKRQAAAVAVEWVRPGMRLGLGTGSTAKHFVELLAERVRSGLQRFAAHHHVPHLYHETVTTAWVRLLATHHENSFEEFLHSNERRLTMDPLHQFWTPDLLASEEAKKGWTPPDRKQLPLA